MKLWRQLSQQMKYRKFFAAHAPNEAKADQILITGPGRTRIGKGIRAKTQIKAFPSPLFFNMMNHAGLMPVRADGAVA